MSTLNSRLQLSILNRKKGKNVIEKGFTLVELMIVIVIVGVLSSVALPNFLGTKSKAEAQSVIGAMAAQAKLCGANMIIGDPAALDAVTGLTVSAPCAGTASVTVKNAAFADGSKISGVNCGGTKHDGTPSDKVCTLTVDEKTGTFSGTWGES